MKIINVVVLFGAAVVLAACGSSTPPASPSVAPPPTQKVGDPCTGKDSKGIPFKGTLSQETKGGLNCVAGGGAR